MKTYSQASQDIFVRILTNNKTNGTFLEIGSNHPININNSFLLETKYAWKGIMVEYESKFLDLYKQTFTIKKDIINSITKNIINSDWFNKYI